MNPTPQSILRGHTLVGTYDDVRRIRDDVITLRLRIRHVNLSGVKKNS